MNQYKFLNKVIGWIVFAISAITYILTTEASASFWDCGEFISTADKLLVGHPPGAPFFMIVGRIFAIMAPSADLVAKAINIMSALASAFTILFLFWTITHLARKIFIDNVEGEIAKWRVWSVIGAGAVGALAYTFSDTFWFSAVEGEVYAMSSLFTAIVFWAILRWEDCAEQPRANRWIVLIAYLMGLSIGVHLLNLLCIPAIVMVYYFKKYPVTTIGIIKAFALSCVLIIAILYGIIPGVVKIASYFELFFVNGLGLGYNSGAIFYMFLLIGLVIWSIWYTYKNKKRIMNLIITSFAVIVLGYTSFAMVVIRSAANPTMDQNSPEDVFSLMDYLNREQYGNCPLFYGQHFNAKIDRQASAKTKGSPEYIQRNGKYEVVGYKQDIIYQDNVFFPRMYSEYHKEDYIQWTNFKGRPVQVISDEGQIQTIMRPTFIENMKFFFAYQCNFMYWRYFMWNFCGRQNDIQSHGELIHGNWITGIPFIDNFMLGDQDLLPDSLKNNKGHNVYFMLPFLLGLLGMFFQFGRGKEGKQGFWIVMLLFFMTGLAIVMYLNQTPHQPRERDYAYAGSFYAFAIWIGFGVLAVVEGLRRIKLPSNVAAIAATIICLLCVPTLMAQQNWDDHDRSGCTIARDLAYNYLNSCDENAIIFTNGDNDTFPLWYAQEVEGIRPDIRICNLSYLQTSWYCDQMKRKAYESDPLPISFTHEQYTADRDIIYFIDNNQNKNNYVNLDLALKFVASDDPRTKKIDGYPADHICFIPARRFFLNVDTAKIIEKGIVSPEYENQIVPQIKFSISKDAIYKNELMVLDMLNNSKWERPMYYASTVGPENFAGLSHYFQLEGLAYRIAPVEAHPEAGLTGRVDTEKMYDNVMNKFHWGFYNKPGIYIDENKSRMATNLRNNLSRLASTLISEANECAQNGNTISAKDKIKKAEIILDKTQFELPDSVIPHSIISIYLGDNYYSAAKTTVNINKVEGITDNNAVNSLFERGDGIMRKVAVENWNELNFYLSLGERMEYYLDNIEHDIVIFYEMVKYLNKYERDELLEELQELYKDNLEKVSFLFQDE